MRIVYNYKNLSAMRAPCPETGKMCKMHSIRQRKVIDLGDRHQRCILVVSYSSHYSHHTNSYFSHGKDELAPAKSQFTHAVWNMVALLSDMGYPPNGIVDYLRNVYSVKIGKTSVHDYLNERKWAC